MTRREIVTRAIEFKKPPRLPFFIGGQINAIRARIPGIPNDVCDCWEMDRQKSGWFFDNPAMDDWGCAWAVTEQKNMGQVVGHPLEDWGRLDGYQPPDPCDPFYFERLENELAEVGDRYVVVTSHFNLIERFHMLRGFSNALQDFHLEPKQAERLLDRILDFKIAHFRELHRRYGDRVHGLFLTDDWGTQERTFISPKLFEDFFFERYRILIDAIHSLGYHYIFHSCGKINAFLPYFIELGVDVMNMQQPRAYGIKEVGDIARGKIAFLTTADIQSTLPKGDPDEIRAEVRELIEHWSTPEGGFIVFNYGDPAALNVAPGTDKIMFDAFAELMYHWQK